MEKLDNMEGELTENFKKQNETDSKVENFNEELIEYFKW